MLVLSGGMTSSLAFTEDAGSPHREASIKLSVAHVTRRWAAVGLSAALLLPVIGVTPVAACEWGCTPGYWKNHTENWGAYLPSRTLAQVGFVVPAAVGDGSDTLLEALQGGGGPRLEGAGKILLRAAVASLLNGTLAGGLGYYDDTVTAANAAMATLSRDTMLWWAGEFDYYNNLYCPY